MTNPDPPHVDVPPDDEMDEAALVARDVDRALQAHAATEGDEEAVLREHYGRADRYGVYREGA